jgi:hypothetical protein
MYNKHKILLNENVLIQAIRLSVKRPLNIWNRLCFDAFWPGLKHTDGDRPKYRAR